MIRRAFIRRMACAAMAGMLGLELATRAPKMEEWSPHRATHAQWSASSSAGPPLTPEMLLETIERIRQQRHMVPAAWMR